MNFLIICCAFYFGIVSSRNVKIFLPNTNYWNKNNWKENRIPCLGHHVIFPTKSPKVFINGSLGNYYLSDIILPENGELILDNVVTLSGVIPQNELHDCEMSVFHYNKIDPDFWYNSSNWCEAKTVNSPCLEKPKIDASLVPSGNDMAVFPMRSTFYVGVNPSEPKILASRIFYRGTIYSNSILFRQKIRRTFVNKVPEFENTNSTYPPLIELLGSRCRTKSCNKNSNLERMQTLCKYATCQAQSCDHSVKPEGSCCYLCGHYLKMKLDNISNRKIFSEWLNNFLEEAYSTKITFDLLETDVDEFQLTLGSRSQKTAEFNEITGEIVEKIITKKKEIGFEIIEASHTSQAGAIKNQPQILAPILGLIFPILFCILIILLIRRYKPILITDALSRISSISLSKLKLPNIKIRYFSNNFKRSRLEEQSDDISNVFPSGIEAIELPEAANEIMFDNPIYVPEVGDSKQ